MTWRAIGLLALCSVCGGEWIGRLGLNFESDREVEQRSMHCPNGFITGLHVRHGRDSKADTDLYDFKLKCGSRWGPWSGMTFSHLKEEKQFECPMKMHMTGLGVKKGRREFGDVDTYDFKLQCSGVWQARATASPPRAAAASTPSTRALSSQDYMGLSFGGEKQAAAKECPAGTMAWGWRAFRGFVERGDVDNYEFDLDCKLALDARQARAATHSPGFPPGRVCRSGLKLMGLDSRAFISDNYLGRRRGRWRAQLSSGCRRMSLSGPPRT